jgi:predicted Zn finger-like uncharacterized protein
MRITCPHCGFAKMIAAEQIPANVIRVSCPSCKQPFPLTREETLESAATVENIAAETVVPTATVTSPADKTETLTEPKQTEATIVDQRLETDSEDSEIVPDHETGPDPVGAENFELASIGARYAALLIDTFLLLIMVFTLRFGLSAQHRGTVGRAYPAQPDIHDVYARPRFHVSHPVHRNLRSDSGKEIHTDQGCHDRPNNHDLPQSDVA